MAKTMEIGAGGTLRKLVRSLLKLCGPTGWLGAQNVSDALSISFCSVLDL